MSKSEELSRVAAGGAVRRAERRSDSAPSTTVPTPQTVFALVIDYTAMNLEELDNVSTLIGGSGRHVVKLDPSLLASEDTGRQAIEQLGRALLNYRCTMLFLLVPWGMPQVAPVIEVMTRLGRQRPFVLFALGRELYSTEMTMTIDPLSEGDRELRNDPEANAPELQWAVRQPGAGDDLAGVITWFERQQRDD